MRVFMGYRSLAATAVFAAASLLGVQARAECKMTAIDTPVTMEGMEPLVTTKINGQEVKLLLDSGAFYNSIGVKVADEQQLQPAREEEAETGSHIKSRAERSVGGAGGTHHATGFVIAPSFEIVGAKFANVPFLVVGGSSGLLGQNFLHVFDDEYDLGKGLLRLVKPTDCGKTQMAYWAKPGTSYSVVPLEFVDGSNIHTTAMVTINGVKMRAMFDTGASTTFITKPAAARAGVKVSDSSVKPGREVSGIDRDHIATWIAPFSSIKIGDEEIKNTRLTIGDTNADGFDILIGADFFLSHHIHVANSQDKLYFTYSGGKVFKVEEPAK
jgi:predicted aspartyl protease